MAVQGTVASRSNVGELLKPIFDDEIQEIRTQFKFLKDAKKLDAVKLDGEDFVIEVQTQRNATSQNTLIGDVLPNSGQAKFKQGKIRVARVFQPLQIDNELLLLADRDPATFSVRCEILYQDAKNALMKDCNRQFLGDGTGTLCTISAIDGTGANTQIVTVDTTKFLEEDMPLEVFSAAHAALRTTSGASNYFTVSSITDETHFVIKAPGAETVSAGIVGTDVISKKGNWTAAGGSCKEFYGIQQITAGNDSFMGIDGATVRRWRPNRYDAANSPVSMLLMGKAIIAGHRNVETLDDDKPNVIYAAPEQSLAMIHGNAGIYQNVRFTREEQTKFGTGDFNRPTVNFGWGDIQVETDLDLPTTKLFAFNKESLLYGELSPVKLEEWDGVSVLPATDTSATATGIVAAQKMWFSWRANLGCYRRNAFTEIYNLAALP